MTSKTPFRSASLVSLLTSFALAACAGSGAPERPARVAPPVPPAPPAARAPAAAPAPPARRAPPARQAPAGQAGTSGGAGTTGAARIDRPRRGPPAPGGREQRHAPGTSRQRGRRRTRRQRRRGGTRARRAAVGTTGTRAAVARPGAARNHGHRRHDRLGRRGRADRREHRRQLQRDVGAPAARAEQEAAQPVRHARRDDHQHQGAVGVPTERDQGGPREVRDRAEAGAADGRRHPVRQQR